MDRLGSILSDGVRGDFVDVEQARQRKHEREQSRLALRPHDSANNGHDWTKPRNPDVMDLESALRMDDMEPSHGRSVGTNGG